MSTKCGQENRLLAADLAVRPGKDATLAGNVAWCGSFVTPLLRISCRAFLLRTDQNEKGIGRHSRNITEMATDVRLRDHYQLKDGDWVEVDFPE
jgi:hypothetical protein